MYNEELMEELLKILNHQPWCKAISLHSKNTHNQKGEHGTPDLLVIDRGVPFFFCLRKQHNDVGTQQLYRMAQWEAVGALVAIAMSVEEVLEFLDHPPLQKIEPIPEWMEKIFEYGS